MQQTFYCPSCTAPVAYGEAFCRNCRVTLFWGTQQTNQQQQQAWGGQAGWNQPPSYNAQGWATGNQYSRQNPQQDSEDAKVTRFTPVVITLLAVLVLMIAGASVALAMNWTSITSSPKQPAGVAANTPNAQPVAPPSITSFTATPASVTAGQPVTLQWVTVGTTDVSIDQGLGKVALSGVVDVTPTTATAYTLTAANSAGSVKASTTVTMVPVALPVIDYFTATPASINGGDSTTLQWNVTGASTVSVNRGIGAVSAAGKYVISPAASDNYTLTAANSAGSVTAKAPVTVILGKAPVITNFTAAPSSITSGQPVVLAWTVTGATTVTMDQGFGPVGASGTLTVSPKTTTTYTISAAYGATPVKSSVTITVPGSSGPIITAFTSSPAIITAGQSSTLQWNVTGAMSVSIDHGVGAVNLSGTTPVSPTTHTTYTLTAATDNSTVTATTTVTVSQPAVLAINSFICSPAIIHAGDQSTLQWNVSGATSVNIDHGIGAVSQQGTAPVTPTENTTYTMNAAGISDNATASATVLVVAPTMPLITSFTVTPSAIAAGQSTTLQWNVTGANSVSIAGLGGQPLAGSATVKPSENITYTLSAQGSSGTASSSVAVTVTSGP